MPSNKKPIRQRKPSVLTMIKIAQELASLSITNIPIGESQSIPLFNESERERIKFQIFKILDQI